MKTVKGWISTTFIIATLVFATTPANAGIIVGNLASGNQKPPCEITKTDWAIIVGNLTGIIVGNLTGIIVGNIAETPVQSCAISVGN
jgi:hypothetical protein